MTGTSRQHPYGTVSSGEPWDKSFANLSLELKPHLQGNGNSTL